MKKAQFLEILKEFISSLSENEIEQVVEMVNQGERIALIFQKKNGELFCHFEKLMAIFNQEENKTFVLNTDRNLKIS